MNLVWVVEIIAGHVTAKGEVQGPPSLNDGKNVKVPWAWALLIYLFQLLHVPCRRAKNVNLIPCLLKAGS